MASPALPRASVRRVWIQRDENGGPLPLESRALYHAALLEDHLEARPFFGSEVLSGAWYPPVADTVVGSVEVLRAVFAQRGIPEPAPLDYPRALLDWMGRAARLLRTHEISNQLEGDVGERFRLLGRLFVKPYQTKRFAAGLVSPEELVQRITGLDPEERLWIGDPVAFRAEYRVYVLRGEILAICPYQGPDAIDDDPPWIDQRVVQAAVATAFHRHSGLPRTGFALDFGLTEDGRTLLVEANDGWALGLYPGLHPRRYTDLLLARWDEIMAPQTRNVRP